MHFHLIVDLRGLASQDNVGAAHILAHLVSEGVNHLEKSL
jgi:hypothetical protein